MCGLCASVPSAVCVCELYPYITGAVCVCELYPYITGAVCVQTVHVSTLTTGTIPECISCTLKLQVFIWQVTCTQDRI